MKEKVIWIGIYEHKYGFDSRLFMTEDEVMAWRDDIADRWWEREFLEEPKPSREDGLGEKYFDMVGDYGEYFSVDSDTIKVSAVEDMVSTIDWKLLSEQKEYCINESYNNADAEHIYGGIVNLIDALQDAAVKDGLATEAKVFPNLETET